MRRKTRRSGARMEVKMKRVVCGFVALAAMTTIAAAADLARRGPYYPAPAPAYAPVYNWTGFYIGVNGGGGFGSSTWDSTGRRNVSGGLVGGTVGYNYQFGQVVAGIEGDVDWSGINGTTTNACPLGCKTSNTWLATVRGRLGYAADRFMPYITGGGAFGNIQASTPGLAQTSSDNAGWTLGAGLEAVLVPNWTAKVEYLYVDLGNFNCGLNCGAGLVTDNVSFHANLLRAGVNYKF
jgi:outer membrane immunogenic protein